MPSTAAEGAKLHDMREDYAKRRNKGINHDDEHFPFLPFAEQEAEKKLRLTQALIAARSAEHKDAKRDNVYVQDIITEDEKKIYIQKSEEGQLLDFDAYVEHNYIDGDLYKQKLIREIYPEYFERRLKLIDQHTSIQRELAHMKLYGGPRSKEDLRLLYLLSTGQINVPTTVAFDTTMEPDDKIRMRGYFNAVHLFDEATLDKKPENGAWGAKNFAEGVRAEDSNSFLKNIATKNNRYGFGYLGSKAGLLDGINGYRTGNSAFGGGSLYYNKMY
jgi:hypothetical protein